MCGRFALDYPESILKNWYTVDSFPDLFPRYNIAPLSDILVIRETESKREATMMRWGLVPKWIKDLKEAHVINNARAETISTKPMFKSVYRKRRCIIPASGFYEWQLLKDGKYKQPNFITAVDECPTSFDGIWEIATVDEKTIESCAIITTGCNDLMRPIHDRMPVILPPESFDTWLKPVEFPDDIMSFFLKPYKSELMQAWPVSTAVNKASNQGKQLIDPIPAA
ncbi:SOS response-associated peptidase [Nitrosomonas oligotropha]|uniref:SOS response-associated peptidase n=1 Tax=Nitrosomonas oligotropha TaxID=42354 RepID=UPI00136CC245|nr:SOS response-associated peptidase [Nitrosomonas oligotropha]MXS84326.1 SOS response-associated peptidase [Nitrosomonas oligotropha]